MRESRSLVTDGICVVNTCIVQNPVAFHPGIAYPVLVRSQLVCVGWGMGIGLLAAGVWGLETYRRHYPPSVFEFVTAGVTVACIVDLLLPRLPVTARIFLVPLPFALCYCNPIRPLQAESYEWTMFVDVTLLVLGAAAVCRLICSGRLGVQAIAGYAVAYIFINMWLFDMYNDYSGREPVHARRKYAATMAILTIAAAIPAWRTPTKSGAPT